ncbi:MAG: pilin [Patescibacteria group bacterium]
MRFTKKHVLAFIFLFCLSFLFISPGLPALADDSLVNSQVGMKQVGSAFGNATPADIRSTIARIINVLLGFLGVIFLGFTVYAGFLYMTAAGNEEKTTEALRILRNAIIGLIILLMAWSITRFTVLILGRAANNSTVDYRTYTPY